MGSSSNGDFVTAQSMASYAAGSFTENGLESFLGGGSAWNPLVQIPPHRQTDSSSNLFDCTRMSTFNNGSGYPSMVGSVDLSECNQFAAGQVSPCSYQEKEEFGDVKMGIKVTDEGGDPSRWCKEGEEASSEDESPSMAHGKKRKRTPDGGDLRVLLCLVFVPLLLELTSWSCFDDREVWKMCYRPLVIALKGKMKRSSRVP